MLIQKHYPYYFLYLYLYSTRLSCVLKLARGNTFHLWKTEPDRVEGVLFTMQMLHYICFLLCREIICWGVLIPMLASPAPLEAVLSLGAVRGFV